MQFFERASKRFRMPLSRTALIGGVVAILLLTGCVSSPPPGPVRGLHEVTSDRISTAIAEGNYAQAFQDLVIHDEKGTVSSSEVERLRERAVEALRKEYRTSLQNEEYDRALLLDRIASEAGVSEALEDTGSSRKKLEAQLILQEAKSGSPVPAFSRLRKLESLEAFSDDEVSALIERAYEERKRTALQTLIDEADAREITVEEEYRTTSQQPHSKGELIRGTVTVWVNRGMEIKEGVGRPDRVIGSGFYIDKRGYIITNYHIIRSEVDPSYEGFSRLYVRPSRNRDQKIPARVVGWDPVLDLALLKVETEAELVLSFSAPKALEPGQQIFAIGSPAGLENTVTSGIVSAVGRRFLQLGDVVQVDVPINQGNSGGPLLDGDGNLIGVVFAGIEQFEGVNFAIPVEWVSHVLPELYEEQQVSHPFLGMALEETDEGLTVSYVYPGGPADEVGMQSGDILRSLGGKEVSTVTGGQDRLLQYRKKSLIRLTWERGDRRYTRPAAIEERPEVPMENVLDRDSYENLFPALFGFQAEKVGSSMFSPEYVVKRVYQGSVADETGLSKNDPFTLQKWNVVEDRQIVLAQFRIKKRKAGFLETGVQLGAHLKIRNLL